MEPPLLNRPKEVKKRTTLGTLGTWYDGFKVARKSKDCFATFAEPKTWMYLVVRIDNRTSSSMKKAILNMFAMYPPVVFITSTVDRGKEFACYSSI